MKKALFICMLLPNLLIAQSHIVTIDKGKIEGYQLPDYCFKGQHKRVQYVYDKQGKIVYIVK